VHVQHVSQMQVHQNWPRGSSKARRQTPKLSSPARAIASSFGRLPGVVLLLVESMPSILLSNFNLSYIHDGSPMQYDRDTARNVHAVIPQGTKATQMFQGQDKSRAAVQAMAEELQMCPGGLGWYDACCLLPVCLPASAPR
jgi:hypothetical protein